VTWLTEATGESALERVLGRRPELLPLVRDYAGRVWAEGVVDPGLLELCRLAIAGVHGSASDLSLRYREAGLTEEKAAAVADWRSSHLFSELERDCIALAEQFTLDPHGVDDESFGRVAAELGPERTVALVSSLGMFDGLTRLRAILGIESEPGAPAVVPAPDPEGVLF
jgi:alkylhydroperoxidase family enzyme